MKDTYKCRPANAKLIALAWFEVIEEQPRWIALLSFFLFLYFFLGEGKDASEVGAYRPASGWAEDGNILTV